MASTVEYRDRFIECTGDEIRVHGYYFSWGTKHIAYANIRSLRRVEMGLTTGKGRIWGTANPRYWASFDPKRPAKKVALVLDLGRFVRPFLTPDDPDAVESIIEAHTARGPEARDDTGPPRS